MYSLFLHNYIGWFNFMVKNYYTTILDSWKFKVNITKLIIWHVLDNLNIVKCITNQQTKDAWVCVCKCINIIVRFLPVFFSNLYSGDSDVFIIVMLTSALQTNRPMICTYLYVMHKRPLWKVYLCFPLACILGASDKFLIIVTSGFTGISGFCRT